MRRVVVTGVGLTCPIGNTFAEVSAGLRASHHGIRVMPEWGEYSELKTRLGAPCAVDLKYPRKRVRTMGRVSLLSLFATDAAVEDAGLEAEELRSGRTGLAYGSTHGSSQAQQEFCDALFSNRGLRGIPGSTYLKFMSHTCAANLAQAYGITGRVIPTVAACASASQGIGFGYEAVKSGAQDVMLCGGAEELHFAHAGIFDIMFATSTAFNERPDHSPRPFDRARDGLVVGEGAATLVLEEYERARARGAHIHAEVIGYGTNCDGTHVTAPSADGMAGAMRLSLQSAQLSPDAIDYVNAHGTATEAGDIAESLATEQVLGSAIPISSTKGHTGHTLGACGSVEAIFCIAAMTEGFVPQTRNLEEVDPRCAPLEFVRDQPREADIGTVMTNNFAFGGINTSLIFRRM